MSRPRIGIVTASTRPTRIGHHVAAWVGGLAPEDVELVAVDLRELALPLLDEPEMPSEGHYAHEHTRRWAVLVESLDAVVLVMPEYNRGYNAALKNAIDYLYAEWDGMPVACVGYGWSGAQYARSALRQTLERMYAALTEAVAARG
jgi:NAD(P)H-dependent FMN reductase